MDTSAAIKVHGLSSKLDIAKAKIINEAITRKHEPIIQDAFKLMNCASEREKLKKQKSQKSDQQIRKLSDQPKVGPN